MSPAYLMKVMKVAETLVLSPFPYGVLYGSWARGKFRNPIVFQGW